ncbi:hypothetical protein E5340_05565 [Ligilactobacillus murinus]|uniref:Uncharacterized protein n=1 Tax=Ligilactobacillus murinus TaxID=1622 RepID=A0A4S2EMD6_9LACO|nr:hypothetical protein [Ligilactobacillus murinus]TGY55474.1 hypothetical protein E5340_05565 [Ligilactobacillus murinus]
MKFYKVFDNSGEYDSGWHSNLSHLRDDWEHYYTFFADEYDKDDEIEIRAFDTRDINSDEYKNWDSEEYFEELSVLVEKHVLKVTGSSSFPNAGYLEWVKV